MQERIISLLTSYEALTALLGKTVMADGTNTEIPAVFSATPPAGETLPAISVQERRRRDILYADDEPLAYEGEFELCIFCEGEPETIFEMVTDMMKKDGFRLLETSVSTEPGLTVKSCVYSKAEYYD